MMSVTIFYSLLFLNSRLCFSRLQYMYPVIWVIVILYYPQNTKIMAIDMFVDNQRAVSRILSGTYIYITYRCSIRTKELFHHYTYTHTHTHIHTHAHARAHTCRYMHDIWALHSCAAPEDTTHTHTHAHSHTRRYSRLKIGWHTISGLFLKLFQRIRIPPMGFTMSIK